MGTCGSQELGRQMSHFATGAGTLLLSRPGRASAGRVSVAPASRRLRRLAVGVLVQCSSGETIHPGCSGSRPEHCRCR